MHIKIPERWHRSYQLHKLFVMSSSAVQLFIAWKLRSYNRGYHLNNALVSRFIRGKEMDDNFSGVILYQGDMGAERCVYVFLHELSLWQEFELFESWHFNAFSLHVVSDEVVKYFKYTNILRHHIGKRCQLSISKYYSNANNLCFYVHFNERKTLTD